MKDPTDTSTIDLLSEPKRRGRPLTGTAKTSAERQAEYRRKKVLNPDGKCRSLNIWLPIDSRMALDRLAARDGVTIAEYIHKFVTSAERKVTRGMSCDEIQEYFK